MDLKNKHNFSKDELIACSNGDLFGPGNGRLPNNEMLMMDRIVEINDSKGDYNIGEIQGELDITPELWVFDCHFSADPVMPGCLGLDAMWQLVGFYLGWLGNPGRGRALGVNTVKFTGEVLKNVNMVPPISNKSFCKILNASLNNFLKNP